MAKESKKGTNKEFSIIGPAIFFDQEKTLVLGDLHIGSDEALSTSGALSPILGINEIEIITEKLINATKPKRIILLGDLEVHFGKIPIAQKNAIMKYLSELKKKCEEVILIRGNHDNFVIKIVEDIGLKFVEYYIMGENIFVHGDKIIEIPGKNKVKTIIMGHEHPAIVVSNNIRSEKYKCILISEFGKQKIVVLPSLNQTSIGTNLLSEDLMSPYLNQKVLKKAEVFIIEGLESYSFGKLDNLKNNN